MRDARCVIIRGMGATATVAVWEKMFSLTSPGFGVEIDWKFVEKYQA